ncbi:MAG TPA: 6-bladed beta-propeller [Candidatus Parabacteroides intestinipullorum]|uniref:6-bladed beta-propeller n=1 Tax=Candidatus Parabacteroides intestinipullorum TaxID=2838723 RepID=A0A9D1X6L9_9BACT|nr:6-bladed beta-propeller [Candidatus Parabacteroides intestinipullorum]
MKKLGIIAYSTLLASLMGCGNKEQAAPWTNIDLSGSIPKEERILQDLFEVKYVALETTDSFLTRGFIEAVSPHLLITYDYGEGCLSLFDRATGKGIRQIKRQGQGPEEYVSPSHVVIDEKREELFVSDYSLRKILVYDLKGNFKRSFKTIDENYYTELLDYDDGHLLAYKKPAGPHDENSCHILISKQDGSLTKEIRFPIDQVETPIFTHGELTATPFFYLTAPYGDRWALTVTSSDTIYRYDADGSAHPLIVRSPSIHGMNPQVFLYPTILTDRYYFLRAQKKEFDLETMKGFPTQMLLYDTQEKKLVEYTLTNADMEDGPSINFYSIRPLGCDALGALTLQAPDLVEAREAGKLKGKLQSITERLDEESNPVIVLLEKKR